MSKSAVIDGYRTAIKNLPEEAFLGNMLWFSISQADVNLVNARHELEAAGLDVSTLRKNLRPVDSFKKASREFGKKFTPEGGVRSELLVRAVGEDSEQSYVHLNLERIVVKEGKKRQVFYEKVAELTFTRGYKDTKTGEYIGHGVEHRRTTSHLPTPLTNQEDQWLTEHLVTFQDRYDHLLNYMDSHAVRSFVREYIYDLSGTCIKESGGLYFIKQAHVTEIGKLAQWVRSVGSQWGDCPLLNLTEQRQMIMEAFEEETVKEVERLMGEVAKILENPDRTIEEKTFDTYALRAAELKDKVHEYNAMLGSRADSATTHIKLYADQCLKLASRIRQPAALKK